MDIEKGCIAKTGRGIVQILERAPGIGCWRCDDGYVYQESSLFEASLSEILRKVADNERRDALIRDAQRAGII